MRRRDRQAHLSRRNCFARPIPCEGGFTLIEILVATAITVTLTGAVLALLTPANTIFKVQPEASDMQQRVRASTDALTADLLMTGAGIDSGPAAGPLINYFAPVLPYRTGELADDPSAGVRFRSDALTVSYASSPSAQTTLGSPLTFASHQLIVNAQPNCPAATQRRVCGFEDGARILLLDPGGTHDVVTATDVQNPVINVQYGGSLSDAYAVGTQVVQVETRTYYLKNAAAGSQLMLYDGYRSDLPLIDNVVSLEFRYFGDPQPPRVLPGQNPAEGVRLITTYGPSPPAVDVNNENDTWPAGENCAFAVQDGQPVPRLTVLSASNGPVPLSSSMLLDGPWCPDETQANRFDADLLRVRRVSVMLRVQSAVASLRGPAGVLFRHGGTATSAGRSMPDLEVHFDVAPRNLNLQR